MALVHVDTLFRTGMFDIRSSFDGQLEVEVCRRSEVVTLEALKSSIG